MSPIVSKERGMHKGENITGCYCSGGELVCIWASLPGVSRVGLRITEPLGWQVDSGQVDT